ncbi:MAG: hypothetical protein RJA36_3355 [Pseudomonadota bacterium]|jgi:hypothetical protein
MDNQLVAQDRFERLSSKLAQLEALLTVVGGGGVENFRNQDQELQAYYLGLCAKMAGECRNLCESLHLAELDGVAPPRPSLLN